MRISMSREILINPVTVVAALTVVASGVSSRINDAAYGMFQSVADLFLKVIPFLSINPTTAAAHYDPRAYLGAKVSTLLILPFVATYYAIRTHKKARIEYGERRQKERAEGIAFSLLIFVSAAYTLAFDNRLSGSYLSTLLNPRSLSMQAIIEICGLSILGISAGIIVLLVQPKGRARWD